MLGQGDTLPHSAKSVIKTLALLKLTHVFMNLPDPNKTFLDDLSWLGIKHQLLSLFVGRKNRIKRLLMFQTYKAGRLKMVDVKSFVVCFNLFKDYLSEEKPHQW